MWRYKNYAIYDIKTFFSIQRTHNCRRHISDVNHRIYCLTFERGNLRQEQKTPINVTNTKNKQGRTFFNYDGRGIKPRNLLGFMSDLISELSFVLAFKPLWKFASQANLSELLNRKIVSLFNLIENNILRERETLKWSTGRP